MFLRKHKSNQTNKIVELKDNLKLKVKTAANYKKTVATWEKEKKAAIKLLETQAKATKPTANKKEIAELIKEDKDTISQQFTDNLNALKDELTETYFLQKQTALTNYPIFMAIAEDIGYDATGRATNTNELVEIGEELEKFIAHINNTEI